MKTLPISKFFYRIKIKVFTLKVVKQIIFFFQTIKKYLVLIIIGLLILSSTIIYHQQKRIENYQTKRVMKLDPYWESYQKYRKIRSIDLHTAVIETELKTNKNLIIIDTLRKMGAKFNVVNMDEFSAAVEGYTRLGLNSYVWNHNEIRPGDIIVFKPRVYRVNVAPPVGIVERIESNQIRYMHISDSGLEFSWVSCKPRHYSIAAIVQMSFSMWSGVEIENAFRVTQRFHSKHNGYDIVLGNKYNRVYSFSDGEVVTCWKWYSKRNWNINGNYITVRYKEGNDVYDIVYVHMMTVAVHKGDKIKRGQYLGQYAKVGLSTGEHLHVTFKKNGVAEDPFPLLLANAKNIFWNFNGKFQYATNIGNRDKIIL